MKKEFILYEEAKALKELGFSELCLKGFYNQVEIYSNIYSPIDFNNKNQSRKFISCPLYQQAFRWFRKKHMLKGEVGHSNSNGSNKFTIWKWNFDNNVGHWERIGYIGTYNTWEEAELACLRRLIEIVKI